MSGILGNKTKVEEFYLTLYTIFELQTNDKFYDFLY